MQEHTQNSSSSTTSSTKRKKQKGGFLRVLFYFVLLMLFVGAIAWGTWSYTLYLDTKKQLTKLNSLEGQQEIAQQEIQKVLDQLDDHIILPADEEPLVATIVDAAALAAEQSFYEGASDGDRIVIYPEAQKAILFSTEKDIIVNVGPVFIEEDQAGAQQPAGGVSDLPTNPAAVSESTEEPIDEDEVSAAADDQPVEELTP